MKEMSRDDFDFFKAMIYRIAGISLSEAKIALLRSRLRPRVQELGLGGFGDYRSYLQGLPPEHPEWQDFVNRITTNKTDWFREPMHFAHLLGKHLPSWKARAQSQGKTKLSAWSAACSTGEEPYTLSTVLRYAPPFPLDFEILATDIDTQVLNQARNGVYPIYRMEQVPAEFRERSFVRGTGEIKNWMKVSREVREPVTFAPFNLLSEDPPAEAQFDVIFCRNVMIYFSRESIAHVAELLYRSAAPGAILFIGQSESLQSVKTRWKYVKPSVFLKAA